MGSSLEGSLGLYSSEQALLIQEEDKKYKQERLRAELLISSSGSADAIKRIYQATKSPLDKDRYQDEFFMYAAMKDALRADYKRMSLLELQNFINQNPELSDILESKYQDIQEKIKHRLSGLFVAA